MAYFVEHLLLCHNVLFSSVKQALKCTNICFIDFYLATLVDRVEPEILRSGYEWQKRTQAFMNAFSVASAVKQDIFGQSDERNGWISLVGDEVTTSEGHDTVNFLVWPKSSSFLDTHHRRIVASHGSINPALVFYRKGVNIQVVWCSGGCTDTLPQ